MKKNVLALSIATAVVGFAGSAHAIQTLGTAATATQLAFGDTGIGHIMAIDISSVVHFVGCKCQRMCRASHDTQVASFATFFVNDDGSWEKSAYVPAFLRRYPFWMTLEDEGRSASAWFDPQAGYLVPLTENVNARPLFDFTGQPSLALKEIAEFCQQAFHDEQATVPFLQALESEGLLVSQQANIELGNGKTYQLGGFRVVNAEVYNNLPDATLAQWVRNGWAALIAIHHWSVTHNWEQLLALHKRREQEAGSH